MFGLIPFENKEFDNLFKADNFFNTFSNGMKCDIEDKGKAYHVSAEMAGYDKGDIKVSVKDDVLTIAAKHTEKADKEEKKNYICHERGYSQVARSFKLGNMDKDNIKANLKDGILYITIPKTDKHDSSFIEIE